MIERSGGGGGNLFLEEAMHQLRPRGEGARHKERWRGVHSRQMAEQVQRP